MVLFLEYIWLDREGIPRSKVKTDWHRPPNFLPTAQELPNWNFDASSTGQHGFNSKELDTEVVLKPVRTYMSPLDQSFVFVLCQLDFEYDHQSDKLDGEPLKNFNTRAWASRMAKKYQDREAWFGAEQEYTFVDPKTGLPYRWDEYGRASQGNFYCSVGYPYCQLSELVREHLRLCAKMNIKICGFNAEVLPSQWEFQIGPADLLRVADDLVMARYMLFRLSTKYQVKVTFHPKPMSGDWNGSGCHINFSTNRMRQEGEDSMTYIHNAIRNLEKDHPGILTYYGDGNDQRLTGEHETSSMQKFSWGVGTRHTSVRIPNQVASNKNGYLEDRRPASNIDPYLALGKLLQATQEGTTTA